MSRHSEEHALLSEELVNHVIGDSYYDGQKDLAQQILKFIDEETDKKKTPFESLRSVDAVIRIQDFCNNIVTNK